jgi:hypothetical protein
MPFQNDRQHHGPARSLLLLALVASFVVPTTAGAAEFAPRACEEMSFRVIAHNMDAASNFETRLVLSEKSLVQNRSAKHPADDQDGSSASDKEQITLGTLRNALGEVWGYLLASENLAALRDLMLDDRDRATVDRQLKLVSQQIQEPLSFGLEAAENLSAMTKHPEIAAEVSKIHDFMDATRSQFAACGGRADH